MRIPPPEWLVLWLVHTAKRHPIEPIYGSDGSLYMERYTLFRRDWIWARIHITRRSDEDPHLHDHPWRNFSWVLANGYLEEMPHATKPRLKGAMVYRGLKARHRLDLFHDPRYPASRVPMPCTSLFITGKWRYVWGFYDENGVKTPWRQYLEQKKMRRTKDTSA